MAIRYAVATGNWSNPAIWNGGTLPTIGDDVFSNTFSVTVDQNINVNKLTNAANAVPAISANGRFIPNNGITIQANLEPASISTRLVEVLANGVNFTIIGNITSFLGTNFCVYNSFGTSTINFIGNIIASATNPVGGIFSVGQVNMSGNTTGGGTSTAHGITLGAGGNLDLVGNVLGGTASSGGASGVDGVGSNNVTITGNISGGTVGSINRGISDIGILTVVGNIVAQGGTTNNGVANIGTLNIIGDIIAGAGNGSQAALSITNLNMTGNIYGGSGTNCNGASATNAIVVGNIFGGTTTTASFASGGSGLFTTTSLNVVGNVYGGASNSVTIATPFQLNAGVISQGSGVITGNVYASSLSQMPGFVGLSTNTAYIDGDVVFGTNGTSPVFGRVYFRNTAPTVTVTKQNLSQVTLIDASTTNNPSPTDVRDGIVYASGSLTGALKVPPTNAVAVGVPVDNTLGTAMITITDMGALLSSYVV